MKRNFLLIFAILLIAILAGCSENEKTEQGLELKINVDGKLYGLREDSSAIISQLGDDYAYSSAVSCVYKGEDKQYEYEDIIISTVPVDGKDIVEDYALKTNKYSTSKGITIGSTKDDAIKAYGEGYFMQGNLMTYSTTGTPEDIQAERIQLYLDGENKIIEIHVYSPSY